MNRRNFIKALTLVPAIFGAGKITFEQHLDNGIFSINYKEYYKWWGNMLCSNPGQSKYIDNISIPEGY